MNSRTFVGLCINMWDCIFCGGAHTRTDTVLNACAVLHEKHGASCGTGSHRAHAHRSTGQGSYTYLKDFLDVVLR